VAVDMLDARLFTHLAELVEGLHAPASAKASPVYCTA
jgi:hypothetical protein